MHWKPDLSLRSIPKLYGLIGFPLSHSFSRQHFSEKFAREQISDCQYELFPIESVERLPELLAAFPNLQGLNVTIPYKQQVIPFLDVLDESAAAVGAVNVIQFAGTQLRGYNSDVFGFESSLVAFLAENKAQPQRALILGTGGAAKAVQFVLNKLNIPFSLVSRQPEAGHISYEEVNADLAQFPLIINTTPLGMAPHTDTCPALAYEQLGRGHLLYDLVYNPATTTFMQQGLDRGLPVKNGLEMLYGQAEKAWQIWNTAVAQSAKT
jgi:shikimate dehydrogenase